MNFISNLSLWKERFRVRLELREERKRFQPYVLTKAIQQETLRLYIADATAHEWYSWHDPENPEVVFLRDMLASDDLVFDVGSHHGFYALAMAQRAKSVLAIEPNPYNVKVLKKNVALNRANVIVRKAAVGEKEGSISILCESDWGGIRSAVTNSYPTFEVGLARLDDLAKEFGFPQMLKIDVEGFEASVLRGAQEILSRHPKIAIEVHSDWVSRYGSSVQEVLALLPLDKYRVFVMQDRGTVKAWDGCDLTKLPPPKFHLFLC